MCPERLDGRWLLRIELVETFIKCRLSLGLSQGRRIFKYLLLEWGKVFVVQILDHRTESRFSE